MMQMQSRHDRPHVLSPDQRDTYWRKGFIALRRVLNEQDIDILRKECERLSLLTVNFDQLVEPRESLDGRQVRERLERLSDYSSVFRELACDERLLAPVRELFGADALLFKDKLILRPPGTTGYLLHQDYRRYAFTGVPANDLLSVMLAVDPATRLSGALELFQGYHHMLLPEPAGNPRTTDPESVDPSRAEMVEIEPDDLLILHSLTPHRSPPNRTQRPRRAAFLTYSHGRNGDNYRIYYAGRESDYR